MNVFFAWCQRSTARIIDIDIDIDIGVGRRSWAWPGLLALILHVPVHGQIPDLTAGGVPNNSAYINLGPTGMEGWISNGGSGKLNETGDARQILLTDCAKAPANTSRYRCYPV